MKQTRARFYLTLSLIFSSISFVLTLIAFYLPNWKYIELRSASLPILTSHDNNQMDPLVRSELDKYIHVLYRQGDIHSYGLSAHCISSIRCGQNLLLSYNPEKNFQICHNVKYHNECIFSNTLTSFSTSEKCSCQKPFYVTVTYVLLILIIILEIVFLLVNLLRLCSSRLNDIQLRLISITTSLFSLIFLIIILVQYNQNRLTEPLEFFQSMHRYYSHKQIYSFSNNIETIIKQMKENFNINLGASYICLIFILVLTFTSFLTSSTIEIKHSALSDEDEQNPQPPPIESTLHIERFIPSEQILFARQTKV